VVKFCEEIVRRNIKTKFICSGRMKPLTEKMILAMEKAGFTLVLFGLESGAKEILKSSRKSITKEDAINAIKLFSKSKIAIGAFLIVGLPGETIETVKETAEFYQSLQQIKYIWLEDIGILFVYPGSEVYEIAKTKGLLDDDYWMTDKCTPLYTAEHSIETLLEFKEIILNHISMRKMFTKHGFSAQRKMLPLVLRDKYFRRKLSNQVFSFVLSRSTLNKIKNYLGLDRKTRKARMAKIKKIFRLAA
jgi:radical SAM superfamily enzyme YgiQ (UPF0313 family)